jgi:hypothetical protein
MAKRAAPEPEPTVYIQIPVPADLHRRLKVRAAEDGMTLKESVLEAIASWVD